MKTYTEEEIKTILERIVKEAQEEMSDCCMQNVHHETWMRGYKKGAIRLFKDIIFYGKNPNQT